MEQNGQQKLDRLMERALLDHRSIGIVQDQIKLLDKMLTADEALKECRCLINDLVGALIPFAKCADVLRLRTDDVSVWWTTDGDNGQSVGITVGDLRNAAHIIKPFLPVEPRDERETNP